jgi:MFS family permease
MRSPEGMGLYTLGVGDATLISNHHAKGEPCMVMDIWRKYNPMLYENYRGCGLRPPKDDALNYLRRTGINRTVLTLSVARLADALGNSMLIVIIPLYVAKLPETSFPFSQTVLVGILISMYGLVFTGLQPFTGALSDRLARRKVFIQTGLLVMALSTLAYIFATRYVDLLLARAVQGIGVAITVPAALGLLAADTQKETRGGAMGFYSMLRMVGFAIGPLAGGFLQVRAGFNAAFISGGCLILVGFLMVQAWVRDLDPPERARPRSSPLFDRDLLSQGRLSLGVATFFMSSAFSMMSALEVEFNARLDQTAIGFGVAFSALTIARLITQLPIGRLSDRVGRKVLIIAGLLVMAPATAATGLVTSTLQLTSIRAIQGVASAAIAAPAFALVGDLSRAGHEGQQMSILAMGFGLGIALGPLIAGFLAVYSFLLPFVVGGALCLTGAWFVYRGAPETVHRTRGG